MTLARGRSAFRQMVRRLRSEESGAALVEEILIIAMVVLPAAIIGKALLGVFKMYFDNLAAIVSMPFP